jgi:hypothetical protein
LVRIYLFLDTFSRQGEFVDKRTLVRLLKKHKELRLVVYWRGKADRQRMLSTSGQFARSMWRRSSDSSGLFSPSCFSYNSTDIVSLIERMCDYDKPRNLSVVRIYAGKTKVYDRSAK